MTGSKRDLLVYSSIVAILVTLAFLCSQTVIDYGFGTFRTVPFAIDVVFAAGFFGFAVLALLKCGDGASAKLLATLSTLFGVACFLDIGADPDLEKLPSAGPGGVLWSLILLTVLMGVLSSLLHLVSVFPRPFRYVRRRRALILLHALPLLLVSAMVVQDSLAASGRTLQTGEVIDFAVLTVAVVYMVAAATLLILNYRRGTFEERRQIRWPAFGLVVAPLIGLVVPSVLNSSLAGPGMSISIGMDVRAMLLIPLTFLLAMTRHRLFDVDVIIQKTVTYSVVSVFVIVLYLVLVTLVGRLLGAGKGEMARLISTAVAVALFIPVRDRVQRGIDRKFYRRRLDDIEAIQAFDEAIGTAQDHPALLVTAASKLQEIFVCRTVAVFGCRPGSADLVLASVVGLPDDLIGRHLSHDSDAVNSLRNLRASEVAEDPSVRVTQARMIVPVRRHGSLMALFTLGPRMSDETYDERDERIVRSLADHLALAIENTRLRQLTSAESDWRLLDRMARVVFIAVVRGGSDVSRERIFEDVGEAMARTGVTMGAERVVAAIERLIDHGAIVESPTGTLAVGRTAWLALPDTARSLDEVILKVGRRVGAYEILERIGRGGMAEVFRGMNVHDGSFAAVKLLPPYDDRPALRRRFEREGALVASLSHPNIIRLLERGEHEGRLYLVMELLDGEPLSRAIHTPAWTPARAIDSALQIAAALAALHSNGVVHRDVKASNVILTRSGRTVLLDFGLAHVDGASALTGRTEIIGSLPYIAPELLRGEEPDKSADIWSFGILLYEILTGRRPWHATDTPALLAEISSGNVDLRALSSQHAWVALTGIVRECIEPRRELRIVGGEELQRRLTHAVRLIDPWVLAQATDHDSANVPDDEMTDTLKTLGERVH